MGELPVSVRGGHFGVTLVSYILYQHHHCQVTQPLVLEQLREGGIDISAGQVDAWLSGKHEPFHEEKDGLLPAAYACASYLTVDDTGARHRGQNGYTTHIGNELFAWFGSTKSKSRINFLRLLRAGHEDYRVDAEALAYRQAQKLPHGPLERLRTHADWLFADEALFKRCAALSLRSMPGITNFEAFRPCLGVFHNETGQCINMRRAVIECWDVAKLLATGIDKDTPASDINLF
jgi:hypothetical protein